MNILDYIENSSQSDGLDEPSRNSSTQTDAEIATVKDLDKIYEQIRKIRVEDLSSISEMVSVNTSGIQELALQMDNTVHRNKFKFLEQKILEFVPYEEMREIQDSLTKFVKKPEFETLSADAEQIQQKIETLASKSFVTEGLDRLNLKCKTREKDFVKFHLFSQNMSEMDSKLEKQGHDVKFNKIEISKIHDELKEIHKSLKKKLEQHNLASESTRIWNKIRTLCDQDDVDELKKKVIPFLSQFKKQMGAYEKQQTQNKDIIMRFDEVLLEKAPKHRIDELENKLQKYCTKLDHFTNHQVLKEEIEKVSKRIDQLEEQALKDTEERTKTFTSILNKLRKEVTECYGGQPIDARVFESQMKLKANVEEVYEIREKMVNDQDYQVFVDQLKHSSRQLHQTLFVLIDYLKKMSANKDDDLKSQNLSSLYSKQLQSIINVDLKSGVPKNNIKGKFNKKKLLKRLSSHRNSTAYTSRRIVFNPNRSLFTNPSNHKNQSIMTTSIERMLNSAERVDIEVKNFD
ncbi:unnamed protein product [Moneuplotes crassus]|uniref:Uncharacterized protein n=2 Tax=Euplotes crassus TaxID=5936 RepID=A0AAD1UA26_EUPCR|nr:unnamed protein product [Moneuplotes crassus]